MNTQNASSLERSAADRFWPPAESRDTVAEEGRWVVSLKQKHLSYRCFDVATPEGSFTIE